MDRRSLITKLVELLGIVTAGAIAMPALITGLSPIIRKPKRSHVWRSIGDADSFAVGEVRRTRISPHQDATGKAIDKAVFVWRQADDQFIVYSPSCTDLGCPVTWDAGSQWFFCPCHGGIFAKDGTPKAGPPKVPLYRYAVRIHQRQVEIDLASVPPQI